MPVLQEAGFRGVGFAENDVAGEAEAGLSPGGEEEARFRPSVETDTEAIWLQDAVHPGEGWLQPGGVVVVGDGAAVAALIARDVGRVCEDEIDAGRRHGGHDVDAVAVVDGVEGGRRSLLVVMVKLFHVLFSFAIWVSTWNPSDRAHKPGCQAKRRPTRLLARAGR